MTREEAIEVLQQDIPCEQDTDLIEALDMAIKALGQKSCGDCISRAETQKHIYTRLYETALNNVGYKCEAGDVFVDIAENRLSTWVSEIPPFPSKPKVEWIPVSERLPKDGESVLMSYVVHGYPNLYLEVGVYTEGKFLRFISDDLVEVFVVKAWMPLPEPYEEDIVGNSAYEYLTMPNPYKKSEE